MSATTNPIISDERISPYFVKIVNSSYEVHQRHAPKDANKKEYTKFICVKTSIRAALIEIAKRKLAVKRRTKKQILLADYMKELEVMQKMVEELLDDDSPERKIKALEKRVHLLENDLKIIKSHTNPEEPFVLKIT